MANEYFKRQPDQESTVGAESSQIRSTVNYIAQGTTLTDKAAIDAYVLANVPTTDPPGGSPGSNILDTWTSKKKGGDGARGWLWEVKVNYKKPETDFGSSGSGSSGGEPTVEEVSVSFEIGGSTQTITHSLEVTNSYKAPGIGGDVPDLKGAIAVEDGKPTGAEIFFGETSFSVTMRYPIALITNALLSAWEGVQYRTNNATFRGRAAGEVLYIGAGGTVVWAEETADVEHNFLISKNISGAAIGPFTGVTKKGWELADIFSRKTDEGDAGVVETPTYLYIHRVYEEGDLAAATGISA